MASSSSRPILMSHQIDSSDSKTAIELKRLWKDKDIKDLTVVIAHFNYYCYLQPDLYLPGEVGLVAFSIKKGIIDSFTSLIDPGQSPLGKGSEIREKCEERELKSPGFGKQDPQYQKDYIWSKIEEFLTKYASKDNKLTIFSMREDLESLDACLKWMYDNAKVKDSVRNKITSMPLEQLLVSLVDVGYSRRKARSPVSNISLDVLMMTSKYFKNFNLGSFPKMVSPLHARKAAELGKSASAKEYLPFFNELHAKDFLLTAENSINFCCDHHKEYNSDNPALVFPKCSCFKVKQFATSISDSLGMVMKYD